MIVSFIVFVSVLAVLDSQGTSGILETITINEGEITTNSLSNLTELVLKKQRSNDESLKDIKIYPLSESDLSPFRIQSGGMLYLSSPVDRELTCAEPSSLAVSKVCPSDLCCKLLGFQYKFSADFYNFFILVKINDVNDQEPKFNPIKIPFIKIPESIGDRFSIDLPTADDKDSPLFGVHRYTISQQFPLGEMTDFRFVLGDEVPPKPRLIVSATLDHERTSKYKYKLTAFDTSTGTQGHSCSVMIEIEVEDVNDNSPKFDVSTFNVELRENEHYDNILVWKVSDLDSGKNAMVSVVIDNEEMAKKFQTIKTIANEGVLRLVMPLDYERDPRLYEFNLVARDGGTPALSSTAVVKIRLTNVNDNAPKIKFKMLGHAYSNIATIKEGIQPHSLVTEVRVTDFDSPYNMISCRLLDYTDILYLEQPNQHNQFVNYKSYSLKTFVVIDRELYMDQSIRATVHCTDGDSHKSLSSKESLTIQIEDINDNAPLFSKQTFAGTVEENQINTNILFTQPISVTDKDSGANAKLEFFLEDFLNCTDSAMFICNQGFPNIVTQKGLDFEKQKQYRFKLIAKDQGKEPLSSSATIIIEVLDVNDNAPVFTESHHSFSIPEDAKIGTKIGVVSATDKDTSPQNKDIRYDMEPRSSNVDSIDVDRHTGEIRTKRPLDREQYESLTFRIIASNPNPLVDLQMRDLESEVQVIVKITDINDNAPQFKLKPNVKPRIEFVMEQYIEGSTCAELPYTVQDADDEGNIGPHCCTVTLENDYDNLFSLMTNTPSYICLMKRPSTYQSVTVTLIAKDRPNDPQKSLISKISFPVLIKYDPNTKIPLYPETVDPEPTPHDSRNIVIIAILTTVVLVFLIIIVIIVIIIRRCSLTDNDYSVRKRNQSDGNSTSKDIHTNINSLMNDQSHILNSGKVTVPRGYMPSPHYSDSLQKTICRSNHQSQSTASSPFTPPVYHQIMTNQGLRLMTNPRQQQHVTDQYIYEWPLGTEEQHRPITVSRSVLNSSLEKVRSLSPTMSESIRCQSKPVEDAQHDSGYQILNPFSSSCSPQRQTINYRPEELISYENNDNRSLTLLNNFYDDEQREQQSNKTTPMTMKRNYFQTTFV